MIDFMPIIETLMLFVPKIVSWLLTYSIHSTILLAAVWMITKMIRHQYPKIHDSLWKAALVGALLTTTFQMLSGVEPVAGRHTISANSDQQKNIIENLKQHQGFSDKLDQLKAVCDSLNVESSFAMTAGIADTSALKWISPDVVTMMPSQLTETIEIDTALIAACRTKALAMVDDHSNPDHPLTARIWVGEGKDLMPESGISIPGGQLIEADDAQQLPTRGMIMKVEAETSGDADSILQAISPLTAAGINQFTLGGGQQPLNYEFVSNEMNWFHWLILIWFFGAVIFTIRYFESRRRLKILLADRKPVAHTAVLRMRNDLCRASGVKRNIRLTSSAKISGPIANGFQEICLPERALTELNNEQQQSMLAHEMAHIVRYDPLWLIFTAVLDIVFFFQPLNRLGRRQLQETAEFICDDWAVQHTGESLNLAKCLAQVAEWVQSKPQHAYVAGMASGGSALRRRVSRILDHHQSEQPAPKQRLRWIVAMAACLLLTAASAPIVSAEYVKANMYVMYLSDVRIDKLNIEDATEDPSQPARKVTVKIKKKDLGENFLEAQAAEQQ